MRPALPFRLLVVPAALLAAGCEGTTLPQEPVIPLPEVAALPDPAPLSTPARWADGYLLAGSPTTPSYAPLPTLSYNRSGGAMNITKPTGTTGRYIVTFTGLSALLGTKNTVQVTEYGLDDTYCKPANGRLVSDKLEVRCFRASTRTPANTGFTVSVSGKRADRVFAYGHQPTATDYSPAASASWNPAGPMKVVRLGLGRYQVRFDNFGTKVPAGVSGLAQVNAVGTGKAYCTLDDWGNGGTSNLSVYVQCFSATGVPGDSKFTVLFLLPVPHVAYAFASQPSTPSYSPLPTLSWNPSGGNITVTRNGMGDYTVFWTGVDPAIVDIGTVHVTGTAVGKQCKATSVFATGVGVHCFDASGAPADAYYSVMLGS
jgi:hypothetical protein